jgi:CRP/FNR family transcriptional regulator
VIRALALAAALLLAPVAAAAQTLTVTNGEGKVTTFTGEALADLPRGTAKLAGKTAYEGADLVSVLRQSDGHSRGDLRLVALTDSDLVIFPADRFLDAAQADAAVLRAVLSRSLQALHRSRKRMMQMGHKSAAARIADFLVSMAERLADCTSGPCAFALPMSRRDIGDSLGLTIETVSRQLTELREAGLLATEGRSRIALSDVAALARIAGRQAEPAKKRNQI